MGSRAKRSKETFKVPPEYVRVAQDADHIVSARANVGFDNLAFVFPACKNNDTWLEKNIQEAWDLAMAAQPDGLRPEPPNDDLWDDIFFHVSCFILSVLCTLTHFGCDSSESGSELLAITHCGTSERR